MQNIILIFNLISYSVFLFIILLFIYRKKIKKVWFFIFLILALIFIWARFIEPNIIVKKYSRIETGFKSKIVLISDTHIGRKKTDKFLKRIVEKINSVKDVDYVLIAGDLTYYPKIEDIAKLFAPLKDLKYKTFATLGNHDVGRPGPHLRNELTSYLESINIKVLNNEVIDLDKFTLIGLGDRWNGEDKVEILNNLKEEEVAKSLVAAHNPDTVLGYKEVFPKLTLSGHTHCGQIRIPFISKKIIPNFSKFDKGLWELNSGSQLYVTCGLGESILPIRFLDFPSIDIIETY